VAPISTTRVRCTSSSGPGSTTKAPAQVLAIANAETVSKRRDTLPAQDDISCDPLFELSAEKMADNR
jgi:hypothetical protein